MNLLDKASLIVTSNAYKVGKLYSAKPTNGMGDLVVNRNSTKTRINQNGIIESVEANTPALDYSTGVPAWSIEPQRTNLIQNNATLSGYTFEGGTVASNVFTEDTSNGLHRVNTAFYSGFAVNTLYCYSIIIKKVSGANRWVRLNASDGLIGEVGSKYLNLQTGALSGTEIVGGSWLATGLTTGVVALPNGRYLLYLVAQCSVMSSSLLRTTFSSDGVNASYIGTGATFEYYYPQAEAGIYPTSRIITTGSSTTRLLDYISKSSITPLIGQQEGTIFLDATFDAWDTNSFYLGLYGGGNEIYFRCQVAGSLRFLHYYTTTIAAIDAGGVSLGRHKLAARYKNNDWVFYVDGIRRGSDNSGNFSGTISNFTLGYVSASAYPPYEKVHQAAVFTVGLTDSELIALTTL